MLAFCIATLNCGSIDLDRLDIQYNNRSGLVVKLGDLELIRGSFFQLYYGNWLRGVYSSNWNDVKVEKSPDQITVQFGSEGEPVSGDITYRKTPTGIRAEYNVDWRGDQPVNVENTVGLVWAEPFLKGSVLVNGKATRSPSARIAPGSDENPRYFGPAGSLIDLKSERVSLSFSSDVEPLRALDGIGFAQDWANRDDLFWVGHSRVEIMPRSRRSFAVNINISEQKFGAPGKRTTQEVELSPASVYQPPAPLMPTVSPQRMRLMPGSTELPKMPSQSGPAKVFATAFWSSLRQHWDVPAATGKGTVKATISDKKAASGSYHITTTKSEISVWAQDEIGLKFAATTLAELYGNRDGVVGLPQVEIVDYPVVDWRGVHMFVGPQALAYQTRLMDRVLVPSRLNQVVLQCEQTDWECMPKIRTAQTMSKKDLAMLIERYRNQGIEPTPLIQSWGHMRWFFANSQNLDVAWNPKNAFGIDPRKPEARDRVEKIWREAHALFRPKIMHFGLDEIDLNGMEKNPELVTKMWCDYVPILSNLAAKLGSKPMFWSDKALAPGEGPDACHAETKDHAKRRRDAIPDGAFIGDWHYKDVDDPKIYTSLKIWQDSGQVPIATTWNRPNNIRGFIKAAAERKTGFLQSTWAGYTSSQEAMLSEFSQMASYIYAGECGWRGDAIEPNLPIERLQQLYFGEAKSAKPLYGFLAATSPGKQTSTASDGTVQYKTNAPLTALCYSLERATSSRPTTAIFALDQPLSTLRLTVNCRARLRDGQVVGKIVATTNEGKVVTRTIKYGQDVRCDRDVVPTYRVPRAAMGSVIVLKAPNSKFKSVEIEESSPAFGLELVQLSGND